MLTVIKKHKNGAPCAPFRLIILIVSQMRGALVTIKGAPQVPHGAPQENSTKAFAYMQTVIWAYANGRLGARKRLFGHTQTVNRCRQTPSNLGNFTHFQGTYSPLQGHLGGTLGYLFWLNVPLVSSLQSII